MIFNLFPVRNLTTLSQPRALFLHDLYQKKDIDICSYIYHLLVKCVNKKKSWMTTFPRIDHVYHVKWESQDPPWFASYEEGRLDFCSNDDKEQSLSLWSWRRGRESKRWGHYSWGWQHWWRHWQLHPWSWRYGSLTLSASGAATGSASGTATCTTLCSQPHWSAS